MSLTDAFKEYLAKKGADDPPPILEEVPDFQCRLREEEPAYETAP